jgi:hypothetical protein
LTFGIKTMNAAIESLILSAKRGAKLADVVFEFIAGEGA